MEQKYIRTQYADGAVVLSNLRNKMGIPTLGLNETYTATKVVEWFDGTVMDDLKVDGKVFLKLTETGEYFKANLPSIDGLYLSKDTMQEFRDINATERALLGLNVYKGVKLYGYYEKGDTPGEIVYNLSDSAGVDNGGNIIEIESLKFEHIFKDKVDLRYYGINESLDLALIIAEAAKLGKPLVIGGKDDIIYYSKTLITLDEPIIIEGVVGDSFTIRPFSQFMDSTKSVTLRNLNFLKGSGVNFERTPDFSTIENIEITNCTFKNTSSIVRLRNTEGVTVSNVNISGNIVRDTAKAFEVNCRYDKALIENNELYGGEGIAFVLGGNSFAIQSECREAIFRNNVIKDFDGGSKGNIGVNGCIIYGVNVLVEGNSIYNLINTANYDVEGIYVKARYARIVNNYLENAGLEEGAISVKGLYREEEGTTPRGYSVIVSNNQIFYDRDIPFQAGIKIAAEDAIITNNTIEGCTSNAIATRVSDGKNSIISGNIIQKCNSSGGTNNYVISLRQGGGNIRFSNNIIDECYGTSIVFIESRSAANPKLKNISVINNTITNFRGPLPEDTGRALYIVTSTDQTFGPIEIRGNIIENGLEGIVFASSLLPDTIDSLIVVDNTILSDKFRLYNLKFALAAAEYSVISNNIGVDSPGDTKNIPVLATESGVTQGTDKESYITPFLLEHKITKGALTSSVSEQAVDSGDIVAKYNALQARFEETVSKLNDLILK